MWYDSFLPAATCDVPINNQLGMFLTFPTDRLHDHGRVQFSVVGTTAENSTMVTGILSVFVGRKVDILTVELKLEIYTCSR